MTEEPTPKLENSVAIPANAEEPTTKLENSVATPVNAEEPTTKLEDSVATPVNAEEPTTKLEDSVATPAKAEKPTQKSGFAKIFKIISIVIWSFVILFVLLPLLGRMIINHALVGEEVKGLNYKKVTPDVVVFGRKEKGLTIALDRAHESAEEYATEKLDLWEEDLIRRIDTDFLDWYFSYFNQKKQEVGVLLQYIGEGFINKFDWSRADREITRRINNNIQMEFAKRVLQAKSAEMKFETIVSDTTKFYLKKLSTEVENVPKMYKIPQGDWDKYLESLQVRLENEQGDGVSVIRLIGAYGVTEIRLIGAYGVTEIGAKFAAKAGGKAVAVVSTKLASMIDPIVAIALIAYDYWDYTNGVKENKPRLREDLVNSLHDIKISLLSDPEHGVMASINELEEKIRNSVLQSNFHS